MESWEHNFISSLIDTHDTRVACQSSEVFSQIVAQSAVSQTSTDAWGDGANEVNLQ